jgi:hypothetical protein
MTPTPPPSTNGHGSEIKREAAFGLSLDAWGRLVLINHEGERYVGVEPVRAFPISDPRRWISLCDNHGREVLCIESLDDLAPPIRQLIEEELAQREFVPVIKRIVRVSGETAPSDWDVETDRGSTHFTLDNVDDIRRLGAHRVLITDSQKLRYQIPDPRLLDAASRRVLDRFL